MQVDDKCDPLFHHHFLVVNVHQRWTTKSRIQRSVILQFWTDQSEVPAKALTQVSFVWEFKESKNCVRSLRTHIDCCCNKNEFLSDSNNFGTMCFRCIWATRATVVKAAKLEVKTGCKRGSRVDNVALVVLSINLQPNSMPQCTKKNSGHFWKFICCQSVAQGLQFIIPKTKIQFQCAPCWPFVASN